MFFQNIRKCCQEIIIHIALKERINVNNLPHITIDDKFNVKCMIPKTDADRTMSYSVHTTLLH